MTRLLTIFFIILSNGGLLKAQRTVVWDPMLVSDKLTGVWEAIEEPTNTSTLEAVKESRNWHAISSFPKTFSSATKVVWLRTRLANNTSLSASAMIFTKGIDDMRAFWADNRNNRNTFYTGKNVPISRRHFTSQFLVVPMTLPPRSLTTIYVRIYNQSYHLSLPYLTISNRGYTQVAIKKGELGYDLYLGGIFLMILFSIILFTFFQERLYLFYLFCLIGSFIMAAVVNDYHYLLFDDTPVFIKNKNIFAILTTLLNIIYLLFAEQYLRIDARQNSVVIRFSRVVMGLLLALLAVMLLSGKELFYYRMFFYPLFGLNTMVMYYHLITSIQKKYSPSWYFLIATTPVAIVSVMEITSDFNGIPVQTLHDIYYTATFIEMFFLTIGIVYRFRIERADYQALQNDFFIAEINAQNRERERIAKDLHDNIGASIAGVMFKLREFSDKHLDVANFSIEFKNAMTYLAQAYKDVRGLSHELASQVLTKIGLIEEIRERYGSIANPEFKLSLPDVNPNFEPFVEHSLNKIISESVQNILKHAKATEVGITIVQEKKLVKVRIEDNGIGFDITKTEKAGMGLGNLRHRAENELKGNIRIESSPGNGTIISIKFHIK